MPEYDVANLMIGGAKVYTAPGGTALPADTVAYGGAWPAGWVGAGLTLETLKAIYGFDTVSPDVQEALGEVVVHKSKEEAMLETTMGQYDLDLLALAWGGTTTTTVASSGQPGKQEFDIGGIRIIPWRLWGFEGEHVTEAGVSFPVRCFVWRGGAKAGGTLEFSKSAYVGIPLKIGAREDMTRTRGQRMIRYQKITAAAL